MCFPVKKCHFKILRVTVLKKEVVLTETKRTLSTLKSELVPSSVTSELGESLSLTILLFSLFSFDLSPESSEAESISLDVFFRTSASEDMSLELFPEVFEPES